MIQKILQLVDSLSQRLQGLLIPGGFLAGCLNHQEYGAGGRVVGLGWVDQSWKSFGFRRWLTPLDLFLVKHVNVTPQVIIKEYSKFLGIIWNS